MLWNAPGLEIAAPSTAADVYGLIRTALASPNPTVVVSHAKLLGIETPVPEQKSPIPFGRADIKRRGRDATVVATSLMVHYCLAAAETLAKEGIDVEIVDPRTLVPLDEKTILDSVSRTGRLVVVDECPLRGGIASEIRHRGRAGFPVPESADRARHEARYAGALQLAAGEFHYAGCGKNRRRRQARAGGGLSSRATGRSLAERRTGVMATCGADPFNPHGAPALFMRSISSIE
jgi:hypothetical protein